MILWRASLRYLLRHPLQFVFAVVGVALGVAVVVSIDLANDSARRAFQISAETLSGHATHQVVGGPGGLAEDLYRKLRVDAGVRTSAPIVEGYASVPVRPGLTLQLLGVDPFAEAPFRNYTPSVDADIDFSQLLTSPDTGLMLAETAQRLGLRRGDVFNLQTGSGSRPLTLLGFLRPRDEVTSQALDTVLIVDIATAQELFGMQGRLSRIDLVIPEGEEGEKMLERIRGILPAGSEVVRSSTRSNTMEQMTQAFKLNLTALSLLALVVGMFLIYNTMTFSVLQRRELFGGLRALGVTRREIFALIIGEALVIGVVGTFLGLLLGVMLGDGLLQMVTRTINDLYFVLSVREMVITPLSLCKWIALGLGATVLAVLVPALEATTAPPRAVFSRSMVETKLRRMIPFASLAGAAVILVGICALLFPSKNIPLSFGALFAIIAGFALLTPALVVVLIRLLQPVMGFFFGILGKMAARGVVASLSRTGIALAALIIAVSATVGVGIMIDSFRLTVVQWLENILRADIYVTSVGLSTGRDKAPLDPTLVERLSATSGVAMTTLARNVFLESAEGVTEMFVVEIPRDSFEGYQFKEGNTEAAWKAFQKGAVIVSEPYAYHHDLHKDDALRLRTALGEREFPIAGVYYDYRSDRGKVTISRGTYQKFWKDRTVDSLGIYLESGRDLEIVMEQLRKQVDGDQRVIVYSNRSLREASITTFDRTFAVTGVLRLLAILVAFVGILNALMAMQVERSRELAILRANGMTPRQVWGLVSAETGVIGFIAGLLAIPLGIVQALALIHVINLRSFGWTMQTCISPDILIQAGALAMLAAIVAGIYPALRMARTSPALALREE